MDFRLNQDQQALQSAAREFLSKEVNSTVVRAAFDGPDGDAPELHKKMAELGWLGIAVPEDMGGVGMGPIEQAIVCEQLGYVDAPGPYFATACLAVPALVALGGTDLLPPLLDGSKRATVAWDPEAVVDAQIADAMVVVDGNSASWHERDTLEVVPHATTDGTRRTASVRTTGNGRELGSADSLRYSDSAAGAIDAMAVYLSAEMLGCMQWALDTTVQYVKDREAFGRPIGVFQAVQHRCADMLVQTESSRSAVYYAAYALANGLPDAAFAASVAKAYCSDAVHFVTGECIQLHGGIGFTWEHDAHLYFKRATTNRMLLGDAAYHYERALRLDPEARS
ncbi:MAG TPA: acyl-CoA dehydrogenase family protein [Actinomycetota bacterium]|jgi:alkylation response protein AidB-like acyl-CoA dehydrogenase|nr:acyl-CoA dehydrogenase family protein [Actinomycetota bacterium]